MTKARLAVILGLVAALGSGCGGTEDYGNDEEAGEARQPISVIAERSASGVNVSWQSDKDYQGIAICWKKAWALPNICVANSILLVGAFKANHIYSHEITRGLKSGRNKITIYGLPDRDRIGTVYVEL